MIWWGNKRIHILNIYYKAKSVSRVCPRWQVRRCTASSVLAIAPKNLHKTNQTKSQFSFKWVILLLKSLNKWSHSFHLKSHFRVFIIAMHCSTCVEIVSSAKKQTKKFSCSLTFLIDLIDFVFILVEPTHDSWIRTTQGVRVCFTS